MLRIIVSSTFHHLASSIHSNHRSRACGIAMQCRTSQSQIVRKSSNSEAAIICFYRCFPRAPQFVSNRPPCFARIADCEHNWLPHQARLCISSLMQSLVASLQDPLLLNGHKLRFLVRVTKKFVVEANQRLVGCEGTMIGVRLAYLNCQIFVLFIIRFFFPSFDWPISLPISTTSKHCPHHVSPIAVDGKAFHTRHDVQIRQLKPRRPCSTSNIKSSGLSEQPSLKCQA
mmetsp:Transcript_77994/g.123030  ORF Transcript_77994/g.123030 Transcript_77994/m.123030 type:complete len:229 (+) Transcript_77994:272-958(+)